MPFFTRSAYILRVLNLLFSVKPSFAAAHCVLVGTLQPPLMCERIETVIGGAHPLSTAANPPHNCMN